MSPPLRDSARKDDPSEPSRSQFLTESSQALSDVDIFSLLPVTPYSAQPAQPFRHDPSDRESTKKYIASVISAALKIMEDQEADVELIGEQSSKPEESPRPN